MTNLKFVNTLISATKKGELQWQEYVDSKGEMKDAFAVQRRGNKVVTAKISLYDSDENYIGDDYIVALQDYQGKEIYRIDDSSLFEDEEGESYYNFHDSDKHALSRLYRLAQRSATKIEKILAQFTEGLASENDDADGLPF